MELSKNAKRKVRSTHPSPKHSLQRINDISSPYVKKIGTHVFLDGTEASIFDVNDYRALNQIIGYAKFLNTDYGDVYYRGEVHLHDSVLPSIARKPNSYKYEEALSQTIKAAISDEKFSHFAKLLGLKGRDNPALIAEAMLQHYGYSTHFIDVVDNHWVALWFGLNQFSIIKSFSEYCLYTRRIVNPIELLNAVSDAKSDIYQYMLLIAVDNNAAPVERGIYVGNDMITIDLRSSLPSTFLRPHAQHGLVIKRNRHDPHASFDIAANVIAIVRLRIDHVALWIGEGDLLSSANLFPSPAYDYGYEVLLQRKDLFQNRFHHVAQYV